MPMIDIELPYANHSHVVTWLDPAKMRPKKLRPGRFRQKNSKKPSIYNIRPAPLYPIVQKREVFEAENPNISLEEVDRKHHHHHRYTDVQISLNTL